MEGIDSAVGDIISTVTVGDIISTVEGIDSAVGDIISTVEGIDSTVREIISTVTVGRYHQYCGGKPHVLWG